MPRRLLSRHGIWHYYRRVPTRFASVDQRTFVMVSLETRDLDRAVKIVGQVDRETEAYWVALLKGTSADAKERYLGALERARLEGFEYRTVQDIAQGDTSDLLARLARLEEVLSPDLTQGRKPVAADAQATEALLGGAAMPDLSLSTALSQFYSLTRDRIRAKSDDQIRRWKAPRLKAINNLIGLVGDKRVADLTRSDALALRSFWVDRVSDEGYTPNSANKDIGHLAQIIDTLNETLELGLPNIFAKLRLTDNKKAKRPAFTTDQLKTIMATGALDGLNEEARGVLLVMVETGMRPIEICWLDAEHIFLEHEVPHVRVRPAEHELKTPYSERDIPLVGISLEALKKAPNGFPKYRDKSTTLSSTVNKYLYEHALLPTERHSLYSIRHTFKDRLVAADIQDRIQDELMGHKSPRPVYGEGPSLKQKQEWLLRIAIS